MPTLQDIESVSVINACLASANDDVFFKACLHKSTTSYGVINTSNGWTL